MCLELSIRRVAREGNTAPYYRVELPTPKVVFIAVAENGDLIGLNEIPTIYRGEVMRTISLATTGYKL